jgi:5-amino-6-(5-phosphoribosylamino)uracil reductase
MSQRPYVLLSAATSVDGHIDDTGPERLLLSNAADFDRVDQVRAESDAVLIGAGTLRADNPRLIITSERRRAERVSRNLPEHPLKVTVTGSGVLDPDLQWFHHGGERVVYTVDRAAEALTGRLGGLAEVVSLGEEIDLTALLDDLAARRVGRLMVEGGEQVHTMFLSQGLVDEIHLAVAPLLVGAGPRFLTDARYPWPPARRMRLAETRAIGDVALLRYYPKQDSHRVSATDHRWMERAFRLAERCPPSATAYSVGAIIVDQDGHELARGHSRDTDPHVHAEESALTRAAGNPRLARATLYTTLEPCSQRRSRPRTCTQLILDSGIPRVVMAWREPDLFVADCQGYELLTAAGVEVLELPGLTGPPGRG